MSSETDARPEIVAWVQAYAARTARQSELDAFVTRVDDTIMSAIPEIARDPALVRDLHASTRSQFQIFLSLLERPAQEVLLPPQAVDLALSLARRQLDLGVLLQVYRSASSAVWEYFTEVVRTADTGDLDRTDLLVYLWGHGGAWINGAVEQLIQVFSAEREATLQGAIARRSEVVHAVLRGEQVSLAEATAALGHPVREHHTAVVLWEDGEVVPDVLSRLAGVVGALGAALEASALSIPAGRAEAWAWLTSRTPIDAAAVREAVDGVRFIVRCARHREELPFAYVYWHERFHRDLSVNAHSLNTFAYYPPRAVMTTPTGGGYKANDLCRDVDMYLGELVNESEWR